MKNIFTSLLLVFSVSLFAQTKTTHSVSNSKAGTCDKTIKYIIEKIKMVEGGNEINVHAEITINPSSRTINLKADDPERGKISFDTELESIECTLSENLTSGQAIYKGYIKQDDGKKSWISLVVAFNNDQLTLKPMAEEHAENYYMVVDRWEIVVND